MKRSAVLILTLCLITIGTHANTWTSTFVGNRGLAGDGSLTNGVWTIDGGGADVWAGSDAFQFLHQPAADDAGMIVRVLDLDNTDTFAKAGVMVRASVDPTAAMAILDIRPGGELEFMARQFSGDAVRFISGQPFAFPAWLALSWSAGSVRAWVSHDGRNWAFLDNAAVSVPTTFEAGVAVTSHNTVQLATAHLDSLTLTSVEAPGWTSTDVGDVQRSGVASPVQGVWTMTGAGADMWGPADAFHYAYRPMIEHRQQLQARVIDLQDTSPYAKAGVAVRTSLSSTAATVVLDVRPTGDVELLARAADGSSMQYLGGTTVSLPVWLQLSWVPSSTANAGTFTASVSPDKRTWTEVGSTVDMPLPPETGFRPLPPHSMYLAGIVVTSHDVSQLNTAHVDGLSVFRPAWQSDDIGTTGLTGNAVNDSTVISFPFVVGGAGADIWGTADSFQFFHLRDPDQSSGTFSDRVDIAAAHPFAKAGFMYRDGVAANAAMVILDVKPDGGVEFMARQCTGCPVTYLGGANVGAPAWLRLAHIGSTFTATAMPADRSRTIDLGGVTVPMNSILAGFAVTSHDPSQVATGIFNNPPY
jgi:hypothetical protein